MLPEAGPTLGIGLIKFFFPEWSTANLSLNVQSPTKLAGWLSLGIIVCCDSTQTEFST